MITEHAPWCDLVSHEGPCIRETPLGPPVPCLLGSDIPLPERSHDMEPCTHRFPAMYSSASYKSAGRVEITQCNNCLALRIRFEKTVRVTGGWKNVESTQVIEPDFPDPGPRE